MWGFGFIFKRFLTALSNFAVSGMPHPIRNPVGLSARGGPQVILERPELAKLLGAIAAERGDADNILVEIVSLVSLSKSIPVGARSSSKMAKAIFGRLMSFPARKDMILTVMALRCSDMLCNEFEALCKKISRGSKSRNALIHAQWNVCDKYPADLIQIEDENSIRYTTSDFRSILNNASKVRNLVSDFAIKVAHAPKAHID